MSFNWRKYASGLWDAIRDTVVQDFSRDQSEKVALLARDLYLYVRELEKKLDEVTASTADSANVLNSAVIIVTGSACPTGWTEDITWRNRFLQGPDSNGANIGTTGAESITIASDGSHAHVMPNHRHTISADGSHSHTIGYLTLDLQTGPSRFYPGDPYNATSTAGSHSHGGYSGYNTSENTQSAGAHTHTASGINPAFKRALFCKKAA